ncbi:MAG: YdcF family protein [Microthrixaceae bacterium]|nr:YdcF family protein [Microthrixaceae bacterium]
MSGLVDWASVSAVLAVVIGVAILPLVFIPYIAWSYHRGRTGVGYAVISALGVIYLMSLWTYTIIPLPSPSELSCRIEPQVIPLAFLGDIAWSAGPLAVLKDRALWQVLFNIMFFVPLGVLTRHLFGWRAKWCVLAGFLVSLFIELTQLTGDWWIYPCAYRFFDVDDLIANTTGAAIGVTLAPLARRIPGQHYDPADKPAPVRPIRRISAMAVDLISVLLVGVGVPLFVRIVLYVSDRDYMAHTEAIQAGATISAAVVLSLLVPMRFGRTLGQRLVFLQPMHPDGTKPRPLQWLVAFSSGMGAFVILDALSTFDVPAAGPLVWTWGAASALVVALVDTRGISGFTSGLVMMDSRSLALGIRRRPDAVDPRRMSSAVLAAAGTTFIAGALLVAISELSPHAGSEIRNLALGVLLIANVAVIVHLSVNGTVILFREGRSVANLLALASALAPMALIGLLAVGIATRSAWLVTATVTALVITLYLALLFVTFVIYGEIYAHRQPSADVDSVVVLGSTVFGDHVPPLLAARIEEGLEVIRTRNELGHEPLLVLSGGKGTNETEAEGAVMAKYAIANGADPEFVRAETRSTNTEENLKFSTALLSAEGRDGPMVVVTNDYHAFRAAIIARDQELDAQVIGAPTAGYFFPSAVIREYFAILARSAPLYAATIAAIGLVTAWLTWAVVS